MADVFISYSKTRHAAAAQLAGELIDLGYSVWWDTSLLPTGSFTTAIDRELNAAKAVVVIWSSESVLSNWVRSEARHGDRQKKLVNTHTELDDPEGQIPIPFNETLSVGVDEIRAIVAALDDLRVPRSGGGGPAAPVVATADSVADADDRLFGEVQKANTAEAYEYYLAELPQGRHVLIARFRLKMLGAPASAAPAPSPQESDQREERPKVDARIVHGAPDGCDTALQQALKTAEVSRKAQAEAVPVDAVLHPTTQAMVNADIPSLKQLPGRTLLQKMLAASDDELRRIGRVLRKLLSENPQNRELLEAESHLDEMEARRKQQANKVSINYFISYRRDDSAHAGRVNHRLEREFGRDSLFMDVDAIPLSANFVNVVEEQVAKCDVLLAIIGPGWLDARDEKGNRRLDNPDDFIRIEIAAALKREIPVIPILLEGVRLPMADYLPDDLKDLLLRNGLDVRHASFDSDMDKVVCRLKAEDQRQGRGRRAWLPWLIGGGAGGIAVVAALAWVLQSHIPGAQPTATVPPVAEPSVATNVPLSLDRERALKSKDTFRECSECPEMIVVPAGSFTMGSPASETGHRDNEGPQHTVKIARQFAVGQFALTFEEWDACVADGGCNGYKPDDYGRGRGRHPVINVSWDDAKGYVAWLSKKTGKTYRLLTEAEYEYAARAGTKTAYPWGDDIGRGNANCDGCGSQWDGKQSATVGSFPANGFGLYDMLGNVWEWTEDCTDNSYNGAPADGSAWTGGNCDNRVIRGGSWLYSPVVLRPVHRDGTASGYQTIDLGFRVGRTLLPP
jgi:formylglycine-generating enzyme required for sulfatase activity